MARAARMRTPARTGGLELGVGLFICSLIWLALRVFHLFRTSPAHFPAWLGLIVGLSSLVMPLFVFAESLHWIIRFIAGLVFFGLIFVLPWFYDQLPAYCLIVMLLLYVEIFFIFPLLLKRRRRRAEEVRRD